MGIGFIFDRSAAVSLSCKTCFTCLREAASAKAGIPTFEFWFY
jgi:hypothetical protein